MTSQPFPMQGIIARMNTTEKRPWLSNKDLAERYGVSLDTVRKWRHEGTGPTGVRFGRHVRYSLAELDRWEREREEAAKQVRATA